MEKLKDAEFIDKWMQRLFYLIITGIMCYIAKDVTDITITTRLNQKAIAYAIEKINKNAKDIAILSDMNIRNTIDIAQIEAMRAIEIKTLEKRKADG